MANIGQSLVLSQKFEVPWSQLMNQPEDMSQPSDTVQYWYRVTRDPRVRKHRNRSHHHLFSAFEIYLKQR